MSDVTTAPEQDAIAESLLGEPEEQSSVEQPVAEQPETELQEAPTEELQQTQEETADDWLPTEQEKVFPTEVLEKYAPRYGYTAEELQADPRLARLVQDKLNSDIYIRQQQQQFEQQEEPEVEAQEPTPQPQISREQYFANLDRMIQERTDPQFAKEIHAGFLKAFGVPDAEIAKMPATQAMQFVSVLSRGALNLMNTFFPDMMQAQLNQQLTQAFPGFGEMYERSSYAMAWDRVRNSNPSYQTLPAYGSREFSAKLREAATKIPGFDEMQFTDRQGNPLPMMENAMRKYGMLAQIASGQNVDPALLQKAAAAGAKNARRAQVTRQAGQLGSGQSKAASSTSGSSKFQTNADIFDDEAMEIYTREHGRL